MMDVNRAGAYANSSAKTSIPYIKLETSSTEQHQSAMFALAGMKCA